MDTKLGVAKSERRTQGEGHLRNQKSKSKALGSVPMQPSFTHRSSGSTMRFCGDPSSTLPPGAINPDPTLNLCPTYFSFFPFPWNLKHFGAYHHASYFPDITSPGHSTCALEPPSLMLGFADQLAGGSLSHPVRLCCIVPASRFPFT